jgi:hypothetical protein
MLVPLRTQAACFIFNFFCGSEPKEASDGRKEDNSMSVSRALFNLGARIGSLEGYIYEGKTVDSHYLPGWISNIEKEFLGLPLEMRNEIHQDYLEIMKKIDKSLAVFLAIDDPTFVRVHQIVSDRSQ